MRGRKPKTCLYYAFSFEEGTRCVFHTGPRSQCTPEDLQEHCLPFSVDLMTNKSVLALGELADKAEHINKMAFIEMFELLEHVSESGKHVHLEEMLSDILERSPFEMSSSGPVPKGQAPTASMGM